MSECLDRVRSEAGIDEGGRLIVVTNRRGRRGGKKLLRITSRDRHKNKSADGQSEPSGLQIHTHI